METDKINIAQIAARFGLAVGIFYIIRFMCIPLSVNYPGIALLYEIMFVASPFLYVYITIIFRKKYMGDVMSFAQGFRFLFTMIICGTLIEAMTHYIYFRFLDKGMLGKWYLENLSQFEEEVGKNMMIEQMKDYVNTLYSVSAIDITVTMLINNIMWTVVLSAIIAAILRKGHSNRIN